MLKWYQKQAPENEIVLSSRVRLARNVADIPFNSCMTNEQRQQLNQKVTQALHNIHLGENKLHFVSLDSLNEMKRCAMVEKHIVSREFIRYPENRMLIISEDESIAIMVNEEDHLRIQVMANGLNLSEAYQICNMIDDVLDETLRYAFDETLGYLTSCPTNLGTGLRASVMMHLPALEHFGLISRLTSNISKLGMTIRGTYGEGSNVIGSLYQISNQITLGITEQDAIQNLESVTKQIIDAEVNARENLSKEKHRLEDMIFRSLGTLKYARMMSSKDFFETVSNLRLGIAMGYVDEISLITLNELMDLTGTATVCEQAGKELPPIERDYLRAKTIREKLAVE